LLTDVFHAEVEVIAPGTVIRLPTEVRFQDLRLLYVRAKLATIGEGPGARAPLAVFVSQHQYRFL
jgi:hypothetical protein